MLVDPVEMAWRACNPAVPFPKELEPRIQASAVNPDPGDRPPPAPRRRRGGKGTPKRRPSYGKQPPPADLLDAVPLA